VMASPTTFSDSLEARDMWTSPARRNVFMKHDALTKRDSSELLARELEDLVEREDHQKREFEDLQTRYFQALAQREWNEFTSRDVESSLLLSKREPQFNIGSFISNLRSSLANGRFGANTTANANTGTNTGTNAGTTTNTNSAFGGLGGGAGARISAALSRFGFNFKRDELEDLVELYASGDVDSSLSLDKREPQFNIGSFITNLRASLANGRFGANATANANTGTNTGPGTTTNTGATTNTNAFAGLGGAGARISSALSRLGFNFKRAELEAFDVDAVAPFSLTFDDDISARTTPFDFEGFVKAKRSEDIVQ